MKHVFIYPLLIGLLYFTSCSKSTPVATNPIPTPTGTFGGRFHLVLATTWYFPIIQRQARQVLKNRTLMVITGTSTTAQSSDWIKMLAIHSATSIILLRHPINNSIFPL